MRVLSCLIAGLLDSSCPADCWWQLPCVAQVGYFHGFKDGVDWVFVDHPCFHHYEHEIYGGSRLDILFRCALLCKAALEAVWHVPCGGVPYGDNNLVFIANDWHTALLPFYLQVRHSCCAQQQCHC